MKNILFFIFALIFYSMHIFGGIFFSDPYRILSVDGGGIRGIFTAQIIKMLDDELDFLKNVDFFVGTSAGAITSYLLAYGLEPSEVVNFYLNQAMKYGDSHSSKGWGSAVFSAKYSTKDVEDAILAAISPEITLADLDRDVLSVSFQLYNSELGRWTPFLSDNFNKEEASYTTVVDAMLASGAAPVYFSSYKGHVDGGVVAQNPAMVAIARAIDKDGGRKKLEDICLLSLGTGLPKSYIPQDVDWGFLEWIVSSSLPNPPTPENPLISIYSQGPIVITDYYCKKILGSRYCRFDLPMKRNIPLDAWGDANYLLEEAKKIPKEDPEGWERLKDWVRSYFL